MTQRRGQLAQFLHVVLGATIALALSVGLSFATPTAAIVQDARTGQVLYEHNADARLHPASLTKMLTLYIVFDAIKRGEVSVDKVVTISKKVASEPPSRLGLREGQRISLRYLIRAAALKSGNDSATALAEAISGSEAAFAQRMTRTAKALGMTRSTFRNAHGLTAEGHLSTARDMNLLGRRLFYDFPEYYGLFSRRTEDAGIARVTNTNSRFLDGYSGADGIKTGYTRAAGFNLTASAERGNKRIIATVFGGTSTAQRTARMVELMNIGFGNAPANATPNPPRAVALDGVAQAPITDHAAQPASQSGARAGAAKTIRVSFAMQTSPRPPRRPETAAPSTESIAAIQGDVAGLLAQIVTPTPAADPVTEVARAETVPFEIVQSRPVEALTDETAAAQTIAAAAPTARPAPRPETAEPAPDTLAVASRVEDEPELSELPMPGAQDLAELQETVEDRAPAVVASDVVLAALVRPQARPGEIVMTAARADDPKPAAEPKTAEVVTRVSTSGGRHWAVNIGRFPNRGAAERALLQTALSETRALSGALRKVAQRNGGWDANFAGLTREQADLACRRLAARAVQCFTLGP